MQNEHENPKTEHGHQHGNPRPGERPEPDRPMPGRNPGDDDEGMGHKHGHGGPDQGKVGQDTDGDGKVVKPGQKPGQSGGKGLPERE
jgi:hypothetical protein